MERHDSMNELRIGN